MCNDASVTVLFLGATSCSRILLKVLLTRCVFRVLSSDILSSAISVREGGETRTKSAEVAGKLSQADENRTGSLKSLRRYCEHFS
jgi:hypothetical protein